MKYKVIAKDGLRINGKTVPAGAILDETALPKGANIEVAIQLKQIEKTRDATEKPKPENRSA